MSTIKYKGKEWSLQELAEASGHRAVTLHKRICYLGWDVDRAVATPLRSRICNRLITYSGKQWHLVDLADAYGIKASTLYQRIYTLGWSVDDAITTPVRTYKPRPKAKGVIRRMLDAIKRFTHK